MSCLRFVADAMDGLLVPPGRYLGFSFVHGRLDDLEQLEGKQDGNVVQ